MNVFAGLHEDDVIRRIADGETLSAIAKSVGRSRSTLSEWLNADDTRAERSARARIAAAAAWDDLAEEVIAKAKSKLGLAKAREIAHHYRWRASKIAPKDYGDKLDLNHSGKIGIEQLVNESRKPAAE